MICHGNLVSELFFLHVKKSWAEEPGNEAEVLHGFQ